MRFIFHRVVRKFVNLYKKTEGEWLCTQLGKCGKNVKINAPNIVGHPELIEIGDDTVILDGVRLQSYPELVKKKPVIKIGKRCFLGFRLCILAGDDVIIGDDVLMASDITLCAHNHGINPELSIPYMSQELICKPILVGDNCWIGDKVIIVAGVSIGKGSVIGAGSVVTKDIPDHCLAVGIPAKVIKKYNFESKRWEQYE